MVTHRFDSLSKSLATLGTELDRVVRRALAGTPFRKVDLVGYSYGGLVARSYMAQRGGARVRNCIFLGTPNEGTPIAHIGVGLLNNNFLDSLLAGLVGIDPAYADAVTDLVTPQTSGALRNMFPTYAWLEGDFFTVAFVKGVLGDPTTPLTALNNQDPPTGPNFVGIYYESTGTQLGTVDRVNATDLAEAFGGGQLDPSMLTPLASGEGDGVVPSHSVTMDLTPKWAGKITKSPIDGAGTHLDLPLAAVPQIRAIINQ
jgi:pimeloyl-ACP methyl ester carboxylesterase